MAFSDQLTAYRKQAGLSQEQLGERVGVSRQTVSKWEQGLTTPELDKLIALSRVFDVSIDRLVDNPIRPDTGPGSAPPSDPQPESPPAGGAGRWRVGWNPWWEYEYKSERTLWGLPLVHIHFGRGFHQATGIIAIGTAALGIIAIGGFAAGVVAFGGLSAGILSLGGLSVGLLFAFGGIAVGAVAFGAVALGYLAWGAAAMGEYAIGTAALGRQIALGESASALVAIGGKVSGSITLSPREGLTAEEIRTAIESALPGTWEWIIRLFCFWGSFL